MSVQFPMREFMETITSLHHIMRIVLAWLIGVILLGAISTCGVHAANKERFLPLLTPEELARPDPRSYGFAYSLSDNGPVIKVPELEVIGAKPFALKIQLASRDDAVPDPASFRMESLKNPIIDLTPRIRPYITQEGLNIDRVALPAGLHRSRMSVNDVHGRRPEKVCAELAKEF